MRFSQFPNRQLNLLHGKRTLGTTKSEEEVGGGKARFMNVVFVSVSKTLILVGVFVEADVATDTVVAFVSTISMPTKAYI